MTWSEAVGDVLQIVVLTAFLHMFVRNEINHAIAKHRATLDQNNKQAMKLFDDTLLPIYGLVKKQMIQSVYRAGGTAVAIGVVIYGLIILG